MDDSKLKRLRWIIILGIALALAIVAIVIVSTTTHSRIKAMEEANEQLQLTNEQLQLSNEYEMLNHEFAQYEDQSLMLANDSLVEKYAAARAKVEKLLQELNSEKTKNAARIKQLENEIATLKGILRHYVAQIDSLGKENLALRTENTEIKTRNEQLSARVATETKKNEVLSERMTLAEKLNVTGLAITGLKSNGKVEKNITKAKQLQVSFTIPQNNSTPVGEKVIFLRITSPEGVLLGNAGTFPFEGGSVPYTARRSVEYAGEELSDVKIYWDVTSALTPGEYTVELFTDNYRIANRRFTLKK